MVQDFEQDLQLFTRRARFSAFRGTKFHPTPRSLLTSGRPPPGSLPLYQLTENRGPFILTVSIEALLRRVMDRAALLKHAELLLEGETCDLQRLKSNLINMGYEHVSLVKSIGDFFRSWRYRRYFPSQFHPAGLPGPRRPAPP